MTVLSAYGTYLYHAQFRQWQRWFMVYLLSNTRRKGADGRVIGTLLGRRDGDKVNCKTCSAAVVL